MPKKLKKYYEHSETATVAELIAELEKHPKDMLVAFTWEGQVTPVDLSIFEVMQETDGINGPVLLMDAEQG